MSTTSTKEVVLGVTGSIAAYKACEIASQLVKKGVKVIPVLTHSAQQLVGAASFEGITGNRAVTEMFEPAQNPDVEHVTVATRADLFIIAPATANFLAKAAVGIADDWLTTALLVTHAPVLVAPAMNTNMFEHPATKENLAVLRLRHWHFVGPESGMLACRTVGIGKMADPADIVEAAWPLIHREHDLDGKKVLITSGANHEAIDPVRFIGNRSSGKMGHALALEALRRGARVTVVTGPAEVAPPIGVEVVPVRSALEMCEAVMTRAHEADVFIGAAAVADYRVESPMAQKHKRDGKPLTLKLVENPDIIARVGEQRGNGQVIVGFAAETDELVANAAEKLRKKHADLMVANEVNTPESGFGKDTVKACFVGADGHVTELPVVTKTDLAERLFDRIAALMRQPAAASQ
jgi:phosphopantothenoylcysteine decarboxylase/phosphopantothenate--cysteine ligase